MSRVIFSPRSSSPLSVISPVSETPVHSQETHCGAQPYLWPGPALSMQLSSTYLLTVASCPHLLRSQATVEMPSTSDTASVHPAATSWPVAGVHPMPDPCLGRVGARSRHGRAWYWVGKLAAGSFPAPGPREVRQVPPTAHSKIPPGTLLLLLP